MFVFYVCSKNSPPNRHKEVRYSNRKGNVVLDYLKGGKLDAVPASKNQEEAKKMRKELSAMLKVLRKERFTRIARVMWMWKVFFWVGPIGLIFPDTLRTFVEESCTKSWKVSKNQSAHGLSD